MNQATRASAAGFPTVAGLEAMHGKGRDVYVSGPTCMVDAAVASLTSLGVPPDEIHVEDFGWSEP